MLTKGLFYWKTVSPGKASMLLKVGEIGPLAHRIGPTNCGKHKQKACLGICQDVYVSLRIEFVFGLHILNSNSEMCLYCILYTLQVHVGILYPVYKRSTIPFKRFSTYLNCHLSLHFPAITAHIAVVPYSDKKMDSK